MFFGLAIITIGILALLIKLGVISGSIWGYGWPIILILLGLSILLGRRRMRRWHHGSPMDEGPKQQ